MLNDEARLAELQSTSVEVQSLEPSMGNIVINSNPTQAQDVMSRTRISDMDAFIAGFQSFAGKSVLGAYAFMNDMTTPVDTDYNPFKDPLLNQQGKEYLERYAEEFTDSPDAETTRQRIVRIQAYDDNKKMVESGGMPALLGSLAAIPTDPSIYIPIAGLAGEGALAYKAAKVAGSLLSASALYEYSTAYIDPEKDASDAFQYTLIDTAIGGLMMGAGYSLTSAGREQLRSIFTGTFDEAKAAEDVIKAGARQDSSIGSAVNPNRDLTIDNFALDAPSDSYKIASTNWSVDVSNFIARWWSPSRRAATATLDEASFIGEKAYENTWHLKGTLGGQVTRPENIEMVAEQLAAKRNPVVLGMDDLHAKYKQSGGKLSQDEFENAIEKYAITDTPIDQLPKEFREAAALREKYYKEQYVDLQNEGSLPRLIELKDGRIMREEDFDKLYGNVKGQKSLIKRQGPEVIPGGRNVYAPLIVDVDNVMSDWSNAVKAFANGFKSKAPDLTEEQAIKAADEYLTKSIHGTDNSVFDTLSFTPKFLKKRKLDIDAKEIMDYVSSDLRTNLALYSSGSSRHLAVKKVFGTNNPDDVLKSLGEKYADNILEASKKGDVELVNKLTKEKAVILDDLKKHFTVFLGKDRSPADRYSMMNTTFEAMKSVQAMSKMGLVALYAPLDMMRSQVSTKVASRYGNDLSNFVSDLRNTTASKEDLALVNIGMETTNARRTLNISDIDEEQLGNKKAVKALHKAQSAFYYATLTSGTTDYARKMDFNAVMKFAISGSRYLAKKADAEDLHTLGHMISGGERPAIELIEKEFRRMGINPRDAKKISDAYETNKVVNDDGVFFNVQSWGPVGESLQRAAVREMRASIVMPSLGNKPHWAQTPIGKLVGQFKGYMFGAFDKAFTKDLQELSGVDSMASALAIGRIISLTMGGALVYATREIIKGNGDKMDLSLERLISEGFDKGGAFPVLDFTGSLLDRIGVGPAAFLGAKKPSRFLEQSLTDQLLGPSAGSINKIYNILGAFARGDITAAQYRQAVQQLPGANTMYTVGMVNSIGRGEE